MMLTGIGYYPRLGVKDAYVLIRRGDVQTAVRFSDAIDDDRLHQNVNGYRLDVVEPLQELHLTVAETEGVRSTSGGAGCSRPRWSTRTRCTPNDE